jgi:hypothetical protein
MALSKTGQELSVASAECCSGYNYIRGWCHYHYGTRKLILINEFCEFIFQKIPRRWVKLSTYRISEIETAENIARRSPKVTSKGEEDSEEGIHDQFSMNWEESQQHHDRSISALHSSSIYAFPLKNLSAVIHWKFVPLKLLPYRHPRSSQIFLIYLLQNNVSTDIDYNTKIPLTGPRLQYKNLKKNVEFSHT